MGREGKPKTGFPSLPTALGNRSRDSHISTAPTTGPSLSKPNPKGVLLYRPAFLSSGSFFDAALRCFRWVDRRDQVCLSPDK
jgi:hypothetical protein